MLARMPSSSAVRSVSIVVSPMVVKDPLTTGRCRYPRSVLFVTRLWRLLVGLLGFALGIALLVHADLGLGPWGVRHQGLSTRSGIPVGTVGIIVGALLLGTWIWLPVRIGLGTILNTLVIGVIIDVTLWLLPA